MSFPDDAAADAAALAADVTNAVVEQRPAEYIEAVLLSALHQAMLHERARCATLAEERARMWQQTKLNDPTWPPGARLEAQERSKEATAIADAIRAGSLLPPLA